MSDENEVLAPTEAGPAPAPERGWARWLSHPKAPVIVGAAILTVTAGVLLFKSAGLSLRPTLTGRPDIVLFDPVKFVNAQRAAASILAITPTADMTLTMTQVAKQSESVIREEARGAIVLVKQSVVVPDGIPDITDAVLERFGLSTNVPTVSTAAGRTMLDDVAPTNSAYSASQRREDYRVEQEMLQEQAAARAQLQSKQESMLP